MSEGSKQKKTKKEWKGERSIKKRIEEEKEEKAEKEEDERSGTRQPHVFAGTHFSPPGNTSPGSPTG